MKSNCAWKFDEEYGERVREFIGLALFVDIDSITHASEHCEYNTLNNKCSV
jgi:hypothetical protein